MITLEDIAQQCGVSKITVSRALNNEQSIKVAEPLRRQIREIARKHGYRPSSIAKSLSTGKTYLAGYICEQFSHFASEIFSAALEQLLPAGYDLLVLEWEQVMDRKRLLSSMVDRRIEGVLAFPARSGHTEEHLLELVRYNIPVVLIDRVLSDETIQEQFGFVGPDNDAASKLAVEHLVQLGHKTIAFAARKEDIAYSTSMNRYQAYRRVMEQFGLMPLERVIVDEATAKGDEHFAVRQFIERGITAVVANNDTVAAKVITGGYSCGVKIPDDLSIVGMGNVESFVSALYPPLTTVDLETQRIGRSAVELLLNMIGGKNGERRRFAAVPRERIFVPVSLKVRASTAVCKKSFR